MGVSFAFSELLCSHYRHAQFTDLIKESADFFLLIGWVRFRRTAFYLAWSCFLVTCQWKGLITTVFPHLLFSAQSRILIRYAGSFVFDPIRKLHKDTPIIVLGGHTHIRDCGKYLGLPFNWTTPWRCVVQFDSKSMALESGAYMDTVGASL